MSFTVTIATVAVMLFYTIPGFLLMKTGRLKKEGISSFATMLAYLFSPFQVIYGMQQLSPSPEMLKYLGLTFGVGVVILGGMLCLVYLFTHKKHDQVAWRISNVAAVMGNCGFMGIPLLEALLPQYPQAVGYAAMFFVAYNILLWTLVSFIITRDKKYISIKKILMNPSVVAMYVALIFFFGRIKFTGQIADMISLLNKMCTPVCMLILGMRLALVPLKPIFTRPLQYAAVGFKLIVFPLCVLALLSLLPIDRNYVLAMYIISCAPVGNMVLGFAEILGEGQDVAANVVILSTLLSIITIPVMMLIV